VIEIERFSATLAEGERWQSQLALTEQHWG